MKKLLCLVVACMLVLTTVGCTKESGNDNQNPYANYKVAMVSATVGEYCGSVNNTLVGSLLTSLIISSSS